MTEGEMLSRERWAEMRLEFDTLGADCEVNVLVESGRELLDAYDAARARLAAAEARATEARGAIEVAYEWRELRREYEALSASVQQRYADLGRPPGFSAWNHDERERHNNLLLQMLAKLAALEQAIDAALAADGEVESEKAKPEGAVGPSADSSPSVTHGPPSPDLAGAVVEAARKYEKGWRTLNIGSALDPIRDALFDALSALDAHGKPATEGGDR